MSRSGLFITLEGGEGVGKSTQAKLLQQYFIENQRDVVLTREPGGTSFAETIRDLILRPESKKLDNKTELLLIMAARSEHIAKVILPALESGKIVICDRFIDSSIVYQGYVGGLDPSLILELHTKLFGKFVPDITFVLDLDFEIAKVRLAARQEQNNRFDHNDDDYQKLVYLGFRKLASLYPNRIKLINASQEPQPILQHIIHQLINH